MTKLLNEDDAVLQVRIRMLVLGGVAVLLAGIAIVSIKEGEFGALVITLVLGFVSAEIMRRKGIFSWNWDQDRSLQRIRRADTPEIAWQEICSALNSLHFDYARMSMQINGKEKVFTWLRSETNSREPEFEFQVTLPIDQFGLGPGNLVIGKDVSQEPITNEALAWIEKMKADTATEQR